MKNKKLWRLAGLVMAAAVTVMAGCGNDGEKKEGQTGTKENQNTVLSGAVTYENYDLDAEFAKETGNGEPIRVVSTFEGTCQVQSQIAYLLGFYEAEGLKEGIDYEYVDAGGETGAVLLSTGKADVAIGLISGMLQPLDNGLEAKAISGLHTGCITLVTRGDSDVQSVKDLKGKTIGVRALSGSEHIATLRALEIGRA